MNKKIVIIAAVLLLGSVIGTWTEREFGWVHWIADWIVNEPVMVK